MNKPISIFRLLAANSFFLGASLSAEITEADVCVYGGTPAGVMAAVAAARHGHSVTLIDINNHVGGVISGGLVNTDIGNRKTVGGLADEFLKRAVQFYRDKHGPDSPQLAACKNGRKFEPHVAELTFERMLKEQPRITVRKRCRYRAVSLAGGRIATLVVDDLAARSTRVFTADVFIDASYEGDVMAGAGVPYRVGREGREEFNEALAGISVGPDKGKADKGVMAYNYRVSITGRTENRVLFPKPEHYDPEPWRVKYGPRIASGKINSFGKLFISKPGANGKHDANWCDLAGGSHGYAEGDWETRAQIEARHRDYFLSLLYYLQNDPELPEAFHADAQRWGLPKDEFTDNGHFPFQLYVREARRMVGSYVLRESDLTQNRSKPDGVCSGSYGVDCHVVQLLPLKGKLVADRTPHISVQPYDIPYACLTPARQGNLLVPVCCSATHVAYCSLRMEPTYMMLGHAAGDAAHLAIAGRTTVQKVDAQKLRELLRREGAVLDAAPLVTTETQPKVEAANAPPVATQAFALELLTDAERKRLAGAELAAKRTPAMREVAKTYSAARKAYMEDRRKFPADRDKTAGKTFREATAVYDAAKRKAILGIDPTIEPLLQRKAELTKLGMTKANEGETVADSDSSKNDAMKPIKDEPGLPRVLLIGDSISIGYTVGVRGRLKGRANVHRIPQNGGATEVGLEKMTAWLGDGKWDVIHFNFGLHDAKYSSETTQRATREQYADNLRKLVAQMKATGAKLIFATTTPVPRDGVLSPTRRFDSIPERNKIAVQVMQENGAAIDDLYSIVLPVREKVGRDNDVHFGPEGYELLARAVAASIEAQLPKK